jgi:hypothetical protein
LKRIKAAGLPENILKRKDKGKTERKQTLWDEA